MSAKDDLVIEKVNHGSWNDVFVANNNTASGILASVGVDGVNNFDIQSIDRIRNRPFFPQPFDIPIPAGQRVYVGRDHFKHYLRINRGGTETADVISVATSIVGAQYTTDTRERLPPPEEAENALFLYTAEQVGAGSNRVFFVVNINHEFAQGLCLLPVRSTFVGEGVAGGDASKERKAACGAAALKRKTNRRGIGDAGGEAG